MKATLDYFDYQAQMYDAYQTNCVPKYPEMIEVAGHFLAHALGRGNSAAILDLGCGTGNTALKVRQVLPGAKYTCLDGSDEMLSHARKKLDQAEMVAALYHRADLLDPSWAGTLPDRSFDAVVSVLVLEHLPFDAYRACIGEAIRVLKPGGWLVTVEGYEERLSLDLFYDEMGRRETEAVEKGIITQSQLHEMKILSAQHEKHYLSPMQWRKEWWLEAGFTDVEFIWQYYCVATLVGRRPLR